MTMTIFEIFDLTYLKPDMRRRPLNARSCESREE